MNPALKTGVACHGQSDGTQIRRGGTSFFIRDARLTSHIARILTALDGTRTRAEIDAQVPPPLAKLVEACLRQLDTSGMLTSGTLAQAAQDFADQPLALRFRELTANWANCTLEWSSLRVGLAASSATLQSAEATAARLLAYGVAEARVESVATLCAAECDAKVWVFDRCAPVPDAVTAWCQRNAGRYLLAFALAGYWAIFRGEIPTAADLANLQRRWLDQPGDPAGPTQLARQLGEIQLVHELVMQCAERHGASRPRGPAVRVVEPSGAVELQPLQPYLTGGQHPDEKDRIGEVADLAAVPAFCRDWFAPVGPLSLAPVDQSMRFPLAHATVIAGGPEAGKDRGRPAHLTDWGLDPEEAVRKATAAAVAAVLTEQAERDPARKYLAHAVGEDQSAAIQRASALCYAGWLIEEAGSKLGPADRLPIAGLAAQAQLLARLLRRNFSAEPELYQLTLAGAPCSLVWLVAGDMQVVVGIGHDIQSAALEALGDLASWVQCDHKPWRQELDSYCKLAALPVRAAFSVPHEATDGSKRQLVVPEVFHRPVWQAAAPHAAEGALACCVACWI